MNRKNGGGEKMDKKKRQDKAGAAVMFEGEEMVLQGAGQTKGMKEPAKVGANGHGQLKSLLKALKSFKNGDFSVRISAENEGIMSEIATTFNELIGLNEINTFT